MGNIPDIYYDYNNNNPYIHSPNAEYGIVFKQTRESLFGDADTYKKFIDNCIARFRHSRTYTNYKSYLYELGLNSCQVMSNINSDMASIEMHHNGLTIFDITLIITNHLLATENCVCSFDVVIHLKRVHRANMVPLVMLSKSMHQLNHNNDDFLIPTSMTFGFWTELLKEYHYGITFGIAKKLDYWIKVSAEHSFDENLNRELINVRESIKKWSEYNEWIS